MKNKNNDSTANELLNLIVDYKRKVGEGDVAYAYASGVLVSIMDWSTKMNEKGHLQQEINREYNHFSDKMKQVVTEVLA